MMTLIGSVILSAGLHGPGLSIGLPEASPQSKIPRIEEPASDHEYPAYIRSTLSKKEAAGPKPRNKVLDLLGLGIREKTIFNVNVYSYVLYVDRAFVKKEFAKYKGKKLSKVEKDAELFKTLLTQNTTKELRIRFCRKVDAEDVVSAFEDSLKPRILAAKAKMKGTEKEKLKSLEAFRAFFDLDKLKSGNELRFTWHPDGTLTTIVTGERKPDVEDKHLAQALFDVYLGDDPISKSGKKNLVKRLPELVAK